MKHKIFIISLISIITLSQAVCQTSRNDAEFNLIKKEYVVNKDGSIDYTYRKELKLLSLRSFFSIYGETFIVYNPDYQTLKINEAYTLRADGSKVETPANAFNEVLPSSCADCARYNNMKEMVVTHTALEYNATIVLDYTIHSEPKFNKELMDVIEFVEYSPVKEYDVTVSVPKTMEIRERMLNLRLGATITENDNFKQYHWNIKNLKQSYAEPYLPNDKDLYPVLVFTTAKDMTKAYFSFVNQNAFINMNIPESKETINQIIGEKGGEFKNILAIRDYVVDNVVTNSISIKYNNYVLADASTTWKANCGNEAEKAVLLCAMLNEAGYSAMPVAFAYEPMHNDAVGCLDIIEHWGAKINFKNKDIVLSPVSKDNRSLETVYQGYIMYPISATAETFRAKPLPVIANTVNLKSKLDIDKQALNGNISVDATSAQVPYFQIFAQRDKAANLITNVKVDVDNVKVDGSHITFVGDVNSNNRDMKSGYYSFMIPEVKCGYTIDATALNTKREAPLYATNSSEKYEYTIAIPTDCKFVTKACDIKENYNFGSVHISIKIDEQTATISRELTVYNNVIAIADYDNFRKMMILWDNETYKTVIYKM